MHIYFYDYLQIITFVKFLNFIIVQMFYLLNNFLNNYVNILQ